MTLAFLCCLIFQDFSGFSDEIKALELRVRVNKILQIFLSMTDEGEQDLAITSFLDTTLLRIFSRVSWNYSN